jgi:hypothetical protein
MDPYAPVSRVEERFHCKRGSSKEWALKKRDGILRTKPPIDASIFANFAGDVMASISRTWKQDIRLAGIRLVESDTAFIFLDTCGPLNCPMVGG